MGPGMPVIAANLLTAGLRATFKDTYDSTYQGLKESGMSDMMHIDVPSDKITETYAYAESAPHPVRVARGDNMPHKNFKSVQWSVTAVDWMMALDYHQNDVDDDQVGAIMPRAQDGAKNFALLDERLFYQVMTNATDSRLLATIPTAPDTGALYATTINSVNRFGASSGNLLTGAGVATPQTVLNDFMSAVAQFNLFQDTEGQPWHADDVYRKGFMVLFNTTNNRIMQLALGSNPTFMTQTSGGSIAAAAIPNVATTTAGLPVKLYGSQRITDNSFYVFLVGDPRKAVFTQLRKPLEVTQRTTGNSDSARETRILGVNMFARKGAGLRLPLGTVKVSN